MENLIIVGIWLVIVIVGAIAKKVQKGAQEEKPREWLSDILKELQEQPDGQVQKTAPPPIPRSTSAPVRSTRKKHQAKPKKRQAAPTKPAPALSLTEELEKDLPESGDTPGDLAAAPEFEWEKEARMKLVRQDKRRKKLHQAMIMREILDRPRAYDI